MMHKKNIVIAGVAGLVVLLGLVGVFATFGEGKREALPGVAKGSHPILEVIDARHSTREFTDAAIDRQALSEILWAAFGKNSGGKRTIPTARNKQDLNVYAITAEGAFLYDGLSNSLVLKSREDLRGLFVDSDGRQEFVRKAPLTLLFTGSDEANSPIHAGAAMQNVALLAVVRELGTVVRVNFEFTPVADALSLPAGEKIIASQVVGVPNR
ncbi:MAG: nitroreductase family protein [Alphaproteobacteria bacterium]|nr:nitroreductase family protein [Alphaproteobacteria bacterium]